MMAKEQIQVGGQAVIEGVMMRSKTAYSVAVRRQDGSIYVRSKPFVSFVQRSRIFALPLVRGAFVLIESLILGVKSLTFSGDAAAMDSETASNGRQTQKKKKSKLANIWLALTVLFSFAVGLFVFFYIPLLLTDWLGAESGFSFNLIDGILRLAIFLAYLGSITLMPDIRRVFEYHGAEHKSIFAFEEEAELTPKTASSFSRFHPRCGTSFLLIVMIVSIFVFMFLGKPETVGDRLLRLLFIPLIGGISYELIRLSDKGARNRFWQPFILPGLWLQKLTTKEPDEGQLEVALVALKVAMGLDVSDNKNIVFEAAVDMQLEQVS